MSEKEIHKLMEIQYLLGRLDELHKTFPTITNMGHSRRIDLRINKYYEKLKKVSELTYHLYLFQKETSAVFKYENKIKMTEMLKNTLSHIDSEELKKEVQNQINSYK